MVCALSALSALCAFIAQSTVNVISGLNALSAPNAMSAISAHSFGIDLKITKVDGNEPVLKKEWKKYNLRLEIDYNSDFLLF